MLLAIEVMHLSFFFIIEWRIITSRNTIYSRYTPNDWGLSNQMNYSLSDKERSFGERLRADAWRAIKETDARTRNRQNDVTKKLGRFQLVDPTEH